MQERKKGLFLEHGCQNGPWIKEAHRGELERSCYVVNCTTIMIPITKIIIFLEIMRHQEKRKWEELTMKIKNGL